MMSPAPGSIPGQLLEGIVVRQPTLGGLKDHQFQTPNRSDVKLK